MKHTLMTLAFVMIYGIAFCQDSEIETKLKGLSFQAIQNGKLIDYNILSQLKNKVVIIEFWETWCGPCIDGMFHLKKLKDKYPNDLIVICVSSDGFNKSVDFINKTSYPFDYIFDESKKLSKIFPHSGIPFSVVIDKNGKIKAETRPVYIDEIQMNKMLLGNAMNVPVVKDFNPNDLESKKNVSLVTFELLNHELGERAYSKLTQSKYNKRIVTGYQANAFIDTTETITEYITSRKNILQLYQFAYGDISENRFIYSDELNHIKSNTPNNLYTLNFKVSDLFGDFNTVLINQLNGALGLETEIIRKDTTVLILKKIDVNGNSIKLSNPQIGKSINSTISSHFFSVSGNRIDLNDLVKLLADKTNKLVEYDIIGDLSYELEISMDKPTEDIDTWIEYFKKEGIHLTLEKRTIEFVRIKKAAHNIV